MSGRGVGLALLAVPIVASDGSAQSAVPTWEVESTPITQVGVVEGADAEMFISAYDAALLPDGGVVVLDIGAVELRFFDGSAELIAVSGRAGEGPGEFLAPWAVEVIDGLVRVWDYRRRVVSSWSPVGDFVDEWRVEHHPTIHEGDMWPDGSLAIPQYAPGGGRPPQSGSYRPAATLLRYPDADADPQDLGNFPWDETTVGAGYSPFRARSEAAAGGTPLQIFVGDDTNSPLVRHYDADGELLGLVELVDVREEVTNEAWETLTPAEQEIRPGVRVERPDAPSLTPAFTDLAVDPTGALWAITTSTSGEQTAIVYEQGQAAAVVELPRHERFLALGVDKIVVMALGPFDAEVVQVFSYGRR